eukprot:CAMPEP_0114350250 /NCGR_PEP_ID=MMETSP0101-20121206/16200_1 /TAXON_ID=38822 ORGANISM="Pteridomonas danica, Strain PT" /NCGR_SAMPLE_ID=MMETSP0101 /ASSEMBLY_ACC=CAM_ASM_000211 /LENGTH=147 /DNA_ID=CAMNT_0001489347 /DNA_START=199 /DNA_END=642 /DNA_ORIENTATION=+
MAFYQEALGGELDIMGWKGTKFAEKMSSEDAEGVMHCTLKAGDTNFMACDAKGGPCEVIPGNDVAISVNFDSEEDIRAAYNKLSIDATIIQALEKSFWGAWFGQFIDKFGKRWMLHFQIPKPSELKEAQADQGSPKKAKTEESDEKN